ncbi:MAG: nucleoside triphosphate pyrophosphohydrolase [Lysobacteraceae bacterium]
MNEAEAPLSRLRALMARLRDPAAGCPWDLRQTFASIAPMTVEEAHEVADAAERGDMADLREELGDLLLHVVFHARMAEEGGHFDLDDVARGIVDKMVRRHPHVFADQPAADGEAAHGRNWEAIKREERAARGGDDSLLAGIARGLPAWLRAIKLQKRAALAGFEWPDPMPVLDKLVEEVEEARDEFRAVAVADDPPARERLADEIGDILFVAVNVARHAGVDPDAALRRANAKFERRFRAMEALARAGGASLADLPLAEQERFWQTVKQGERATGESA